MFSFRYHEMMSGMTMIFLTVMFFPPGILSQARERSFGAVPSQERRHEEVLVWGILSHALLRRHAWLAGPPANTCSRNLPQNKRQQLPALSVSSLCRSQAPATAPRSGLNPPANTPPPPQIGAIIPHVNQ